MTADWARSSDMKIYSTGYRGNRKAISHCEAAARRYAPLILKGVDGRVNSIQLRHMKRSNDAEVINGYRTIKGTKGNHVIDIPRRYRSHYRSEWLVVHDLCHLRQILEGRLNTSVRRVRYRKPQDSAPAEFKMLNPKEPDVESWVWKRLPDGKLFDNGHEHSRQPWEAEVDRRTNEILGDRVVKAWKKWVIP